MLIKLIQFISRLLFKNSELRGKIIQFYVPTEEVWTVAYDFSRLRIFIFPLDLLSYLTGNADTSSSIDKSAPTEMGRPRPRNETQVNDVFAQNIKSLFWFQIL